MIRDLFAAFGAIVLALGILGALNIGHFRLYYGDDPRGCMKMEDELA